MNAMIGLEMHVKLATATKLFCSDSNDYENAEPNTKVCPICMGFPGSKPSLNAKAVELATTAALALNCRVNDSMSFSRKTYFYPDLAKNFQITQYEKPIAEAGSIEINGKKIRIRRIQIEEDPAKTIHVGGSINNAKYVNLDYNRSGTPLIEIVTEPDIGSGNEARKVVEEVAVMLDHIGVFRKGADASMRVDVNVSVDGGKRVEIKNVTGAMNVERAALFEIARQRQHVANGIEVKMETRHFDEISKLTVSIRSKETEEDYGYIFEPDLAIYGIDSKLIESVKPKLDQLPSRRITALVNNYSIDEGIARVIVYEGKAFTEFYEKCCESFGSPDYVAKWCVGDLKKCLNWNSTSIESSKVSPEGLIELLSMVKKRNITERLAKELIKEYASSGVSPRKLAAAMSGTKIGDKEIKLIIDAVIKENNKAFDDFAAGNDSALSFLVGKALQKTSNAIDPKLAIKLFKARVAQ